MIDNSKEYIICAAIKKKKSYKPIDRITYKSGEAQSKYGLLDDIYDIEIGRRHCDIISRFGSDVLDLRNQGFYTNWGRYISREEALQLALSSKQITDHSHKTQLFSEDLY